MYLSARESAQGRVSALKIGFRFTERQARFLVMVLEHSGVFMGRHYAFFAGITHGQKVHDFLERLLADRFGTAFHVGRTGRTRVFHVHHKPLYAAIGEPENRNRKPIAIGRAIERMMRLDAVLAEREFLWLGTERDKYAHFVCLLRGALQNDELPRLVFRKDARDQTVRYFPDKLPIGVDPETERHVFVFLAADGSPRDFRQFLLRHAELLRALRSWTIRVLLPRERAALRDIYEAAVYDQLARPLPLSYRDDMRANFERRRAGQPPGRIGMDPPPRGVRMPSGPAFTALYRHWLEVGNTVVTDVTSSILRDALQSRRGTVECVVLPRAYAHLSSLAGTS
ncbi:MAG: hypothetical protein AB7O67_21160 [Vicinamibacterales bacterium]